MKYELVPPEFDAAKNYVRQNEKGLRDKYEKDLTRGEKIFIAVLGSNGVIDRNKDRQELVDRLGERTHTNINPLVGTIDDILGQGTSRKLIASSRETLLS